MALTSALIVVVTAAVAAPASANGSASASTCEVINVRTGETYGPDPGDALKQAIGDAQSRDVLEVISGPCTGEYRVSQARPRMTIRGARGAPRPMIIGTGLKGLAVNQHLTLRHLQFSGSVINALIYTYSHLELHRVRVTHAKTNWGAIVNESGYLELAHSVVAANTPLSGGGEAPGVADVYGTLVLDHSRIVRNTTNSAGLVTNHSSVTRTRTIIRHNTPQDCLPVDC